MKLKIKVKEITPGCMPKIIDKGDWIDLKAAVDYSVSAPELVGAKGKPKKVSFGVHYIPLGVAIKLPKGYEAILASRSSTPRKAGLFIPSGFGVIDNSYQGNDDEWKFVCSTLRDVNVKMGDRICQFRVQLNQKATVWQRMKDLFYNGVEIVEVDNLSDNNRNGLGSTGV